MIAYVVDASVVVKWFLPEPGAEAAGRLRRADLECHAPDLLLLEASNGNAAFCPPRNDSGKLDVQPRQVARSD